MGRSFYADDKSVINSPGLNEQIDRETLKDQSDKDEVTYVSGMDIRSSPVLEEHFHAIRKHFHQKLTVAEAEWDTLTSAFQNELNSAKLFLNTNIKEPILPGIIYVLTATLTGAIVANRRALPLRFIAPLTLGTGATAYFMPKTFKSFLSSYEAYESDNFPELRSNRQHVMEMLKEHRGSIIDHGYFLSSKVKENVHEARVKLIELLN